MSAVRHYRNSVFLTCLKPKQQATERSPPYSTEKAAVYFQTAESVCCCCFIIISIVLLFRWWQSWKWHTGQRSNSLGVVCKTGCFLKKGKKKNKNNSLLIHESLHAFTSSHFLFTWINFPSWVNLPGTWHTLRKSN